MSPRPRRHRRICFRGGKELHFKPAGKPLKELETIFLTIDELEAIRLKDSKDLDQNEAAESMKISQPTFHRILHSARKKVAEALIQKKALKIEQTEE